MDERLFQAIETYKAPARAHELISEHPSLNIAGPTGAGKGTLALYLTQSGDYAPVVSDTTRAPRPHNDGLEVNGVNYWFINEAEALEKVTAGAYIETKAVHQKTMYGTSIASYQRVVESGQTPLLEIDVQGMEDLMERYAEFDAIFLLPPDFETWQRRLDGRGRMQQDEKTQRLKSACAEITVLLRNPRFYPVVNTEVIDTAAAIKSGAYRDDAYREQATDIARGILEKTMAYLDAQH